MAIGPYGPTQLSYDAQPADGRGTTRAGLARHLAATRSAVETETLTPRRLLLVAAFLALSYGTLLLSGGTVDLLTREDGVFESLGAVGLLAASVLFLFLFVRARKDRQGHVYQLVLIGLVLVFFVSAGEELSWGQRLLGVEAPESVRELNRQGELNIHNLEPISGLPQDLFNYFWFSFAFLVPLAATLRPSVRPFVARITPIVPLALGLMFVANQVLSEAVRALLPGSLYRGSDILGHTAIEIKEANVAILFALAAFVLLQAARRSTDAAPAHAPRAGMPISS